MSATELFLHAAIPSGATWYREQLFQMSISSNIGCQCRWLHDATQHDETPTKYICSCKKNSHQLITQLHEMVSHCFGNILITTSRDIDLGVKTPLEISGKVITGRFTLGCVFALTKQNQDVPLEQNQTAGDYKNVSVSSTVFGYGQVNKLQAV